MREKFEKDFETLTDVLCYESLISEEYETITRAAGIKLAEAPLIGEKNYLGLKTFRRFKKNQECAETRHDALDLLAEEIDALALKVAGLGLPTSNLARLKRLYNSVLERDRILDLGQRLIGAPEAANALLGAFKIEVATGIDSKSAVDLIFDGLKQHSENLLQGPVLKKIPGFNAVSDLIGGFNPERMGVIMGDSGYGKTNFSLNLSFQALDVFGVGYINMEMGYADITKRFAGLIGGVSGRDYYDYKAVQNGKWPFDLVKITEIVSKKKNRLEITSGESLSLDSIEAWIRFQVGKNKLFLFIIDYDQKIELEYSRYSPEWQELQKATKTLESLAKELKIHIILMAQKNKEGQLSGSNRAKFVATYLLDFYNHEEFGAVVQAKKNRHGPTNAGVKLKYLPETSQVFEEHSLSAKDLGKEFKLSLPQANKPRSLF